MTVVVENGRALRPSVPSGAKLCLGDYSVTVSIERIDPDRARQLLERNKNNRRVSEKAVQRIRQAIRDDTYMFNGETVVLGENDEVVDGQHRLMAIVAAGKPIVTLVVRGINRESAFGHHGLGRARNLSDWLSIRGYANPEKLASGTGVLFQYLENQLTNYCTPTIEQAAKLISDYPELEWAAMARGRSSLVRPGTKVCLAVLMQRIDEEDEERFWKVLETGADQPAGSPILKARTRIAGAGSKRERLHRRVEFGVIVAAWNKWRDGTTYGRKGGALFRYDAELPELQ